MTQPVPAPADAPSVGWTAPGPQRAACDAAEGGVATRHWSTWRRWSSRWRRSVGCWTSSACIADRPTDAAGAKGASWRSPSRRQPTRLASAEPRRDRRGLPATPLRAASPPSTEAPGEGDQVGEGGQWGAGRRAPVSLTARPTPLGRKVLHDAARPGASRRASRRLNRAGTAEGCLRRRWGRRRHQALKHLEKVIKSVKAVSGVLDVERVYRW